MIKFETNNWSDTIRKKRLSWYGHVSLLDEQTPAQTALKHIRSNNKDEETQGWRGKNMDKQSGERPRWFENTKNLAEVTQDRSVWRKQCQFLHRKWRRHRPRLAQTVFPSHVHWEMSNQVLYNYTCYLSSFMLIFYYARKLFPDDGMHSSVIYKWSNCDYCLNIPKEKLKNDTNNTE